MTNRLKEVVSKKKVRYNQDGFNLDLTYITDRIIAMGVPCESYEMAYRNNIKDVARLLETKHANKYKIYNLCDDRMYDITKFQSRVASFPMYDHNPPTLRCIPSFCESVHRWLNTGSDYVVAVHCKAGKGRTGLMICCYLLYEDYCKNNGLKLTTEEVLKFYGTKRTHNGKGVTIPSQKRYVWYYEQMLRKNLQIQDVVLKLKLAIVESQSSELPYDEKLCFDVKESAIPLSVGEKKTNKKNYKVVGESQASCIKSLSRRFVMTPSTPIEVSGDIRVSFFKKSMLKKKEKVCHAWFNTMFIKYQAAPQSGINSGIPGITERDMVIKLSKSQIDQANKNKKLPDDLTIELVFEDVGSKPLASNLGSKTQTSASDSARLSFSSSLSSDSINSSSCDMVDNGKSNCNSSMQVNNNNYSSSNHLENDTHAGSEQFDDSEQSCELIVTRL